MSKRVVSIGAIGLALGLAACSGGGNPLGDPVWKGWDTGQKPVSAYDAEGGASTPTGAIPPADAGYSTGYGASQPRDDGRAPQGAVETTPLAPPPGSTMSAPGSGPHAGMYTPSSAPMPSSAPPSLAHATLTPEEAAQASERPLNPVPPSTTQAPMAASAAGPTVLHTASASAPAAAAPSARPSGKVVAQRTLPLVVAGKGVDRGTSGE